MAENEPRIIDRSSLHRSRLRLRGTRSRAGEARPRKAAGVLSMVDLLSCAFGGTLFLFMLTAAPPIVVAAAPDVRSLDAFITIRMDTRLVRPIFAFRGPKGEVFTINEEHLIGNSSERRIKGAAMSSSGGVWAEGPTPWETRPGDQLHPLVLRVSNPQPGWCMEVGIADDESSSRKQTIKGLNEVKVVTSVQESNGRISKMADLMAPTNLTLSAQCVALTF